MPSREERLAANEARFREINEGAQPQRERGAGGRFVCECGDLSCTHWLTMPLDDYEEVRRHPRRFVIDPTHEMPDVERVVERGDGWSVVEKPEDLAHVVDPDNE
jgi:hypothetical protein